MDYLAIFLAILAAVLIITTIVSIIYLQVETTRQKRFWTRSPLLYYNLELLKFFKRHGIESYTSFRMLCDQLNIKVQYDSKLKRVLFGSEDTGGYYAYLPGPLTPRVQEMLAREIVGLFYVSLSKKSKESQYIETYYAELLMVPNEALIDDINSTDYFYQSRARKKDLLSQWAAKYNVDKSVICHRLQHHLTVNDEATKK